MIDTDQVYFGYGTTDQYGFIRLKRPNLSLIPCGVFSNSNGRIPQLMYLDKLDTNYFYIKVVTWDGKIPDENTLVEVYVKFSQYRNNNLDI